MGFWGGGGFRGSKNQKSGKTAKKINKRKIKSRWGVTWGRVEVLGGKKSKKKSGKCHELPRKPIKKLFKPRWGVGWGGVGWIVIGNKRC